MIIYSPKTLFYWAFCYDNSITGADVATIAQYIRYQYVTNGNVCIVTYQRPHMQTMQVNSKRKYIFATFISKC